MQRARERAITDDTNVDERYDSLRPDGPARDRRNKGRRPRAAMLGVCRVRLHRPSGTRPKEPKEQREVNVKVKTNTHVSR